MRHRAAIGLLGVSVFAAALWLIAIGWAVAKLISTI